MRLSGLQKEVVALYRNCLRASRQKPKDSRPHFETFARSEFDKNLSIEKRDFAAIEFLLRKGKRQLEVYSAPGIKDIRS
ncbi:complex 1 protein-domain-containing protein [Astrocystis sublimbata]|nr:complex 1 protein-domain-containing protein [Astrocystis sublimbata]